MKIEGIDRIVIAVKDVDQAMKFFSNLFGMEFEEIIDPLTKEVANVRFCVGRIPQKCNLNIELIQACQPVKDVRPPDTKAIAKAVEQVDARLFAITIKVKDIKKSAVDLEKERIRIYQTVEVDKAYFGATDLKEHFTEEDNTLGIRMAFVEYQEPKKE